MSMMTSQIMVSRLFTQLFVQEQIKKTIKAPYHWTLWGEFTGEFHTQRASNTENVSIWWHHVCEYPLFNTLRLRQNGHNFPDNIFKCIFLNENMWISIAISKKFVPEGLINNIPSLVQIMAWRWFRQQAIIWTNDCLVYWCIYASFGLDELKEYFLKLLMFKLNYLQMWNKQSYTQ